MCFGPYWWILANATGQTGSQRLPSAIQNINLNQEATARNNIILFRILTMPVKAAAIVMVQHLESP